MAARIRCPLVLVHGDSDQTVPCEDAMALAESIGYPVLVKAAGGGGGIGMALVKKPGKLQRAIASCRDRGQNSFGNPSVYLEKFIENPRHIEVQVAADKAKEQAEILDKIKAMVLGGAKDNDEPPNRALPAEGVPYVCLSCVSAPAHAQPCFNAYRCVVQRR